MMTVLQIIDLEVADRTKCIAPHKDMATAIISIKQNKGRCTPQDLIGKGFMMKEIVAHWHLAYSLAAAELRIMSNCAMKQNPDSEPNNTATCIV